jgi:L,D-transpeptidase ErfK/SrfK
MRFFTLTHILLFLICCALPFESFALTYSLPENPKDNIVGNVFTVTANKGDTLSRLARRFDMGVIEIKAANPGKKIDESLEEGSDVIIPAMFVLPPAPRKGIVVNLDEYRLYYYLPERNEVMTFPLGIGKDGWNTPTFKGHIISKVANPNWTVPQSVRDYNLKKGIILPAVLPAGPDNPLGQYVLYTDLTGYLLHGTNRPYLVGDRVSSGCLRLRPEDIAELFALVSNGTKINIVVIPYKVGQKEGKYYLEAHTPLADYSIAGSNSLTPLVSTVLLHNDYDTKVDWDRIYAIAKQHTGIPEPIENEDKD